jgi:aminoglycoside phosphotransferase (APT) family kinase protein
VPHSLHNRATPPDTRDILRRAEAAAQRRLPGVRLRSLVQFTGGTSSLTYSASAEGIKADMVVVKVAPAGLAPVRNRDVLRQARVLQALDTIDGVLVPTVYGTDEGAPVEIPPLFVMEHIPGESYEPHHSDTADAPSDTEVRARATQAVHMLARMHSASVPELGLDDETAITLADEIGRWRTATESCELTGKVAMLEREVYGALHGSEPEQMPPAVLHGDWRLGNMQCRGDQILGVLDWEIWSVGDPRLDLAWMQLMADPQHPSAAYPAAATLTPEELADEYARASGLEVPALGWFGALVRYKQAAAAMLLVKNAAKRGDSDPRWQRREAAITGLLQAALARSD